MSKAGPPGGLGENRPVDDIVKDICDKVSFDLIFLVLWEFLT